MKNINKSLKVIVADVCYDDNGLSTPVVPLGAGLVAAHAKVVNPEISVSVYKGITPLIEEIKKSPPDVLGLTNYVWNNNLAIRKKMQLLHDYPGAVGGTLASISIFF